MGDAPAHVLVAGIGNIFLTDDGFGPEVARRFAAVRTGDPLVRVVDYGIRGMHLAYDLLDGYRALVLIDAIPGDGSEPPGSLQVLRIEASDVGTGGVADLDAHGMNPVAVLSGLGALGGTIPPTYLVGCVPGDVSEGIGLTPDVETAVDAAVDLTGRVADDLLAGRPVGATAPAGRE